MKLSSRFLVPVFSLLFAGEAFALHANKKENRLAPGDKISQSMVQVIIGNAACSGSFLSKRTILTAAHCVPRWATSDNLLINTYNGSEIAKTHVVDWDKADMEAHPGYDFLAAASDLSQVANDLAIITLKEEIPTAKPAYLYSDLNTQQSFQDYIEEQEGKPFYLAGNGSRQRLFRRGLRAAIDSIRSLTKMTTATLIDGNESALEFESASGTKVCQGDSGGPAFMKTTTGKMIQFGVVSIGYTGILWAKNCGRRVFYSALGGENLTWVKETQRKLESR